MEKLLQTTQLFQVSEINVTYSPVIKPSDRPKIASSRQAYQILFDHWNKEKIDLLEQFKIMLLNRANKVIGIFEVSSGGISGTLADPKLIFSVALKACASAIILCHNHPSGNLKPSQADIQLTSKVKKGGEILDIEVLDHIIISSEAFYSFADEGMM